ncbi:MAG: VWA domain-containing protein [Acidobacteriia bacterium]|nr:VWA domain-containing protein [Terriglobia bacterium]
MFWASGISRSQDQSPSTSGPNPNVGETVLVPKKTAPAPQPEAKKPEKINPSEVYTISTTTNLVNVDVMVVDGNGNPIPNLGKVNFKLSDDGVPQTITNFSTGEAPMTICMLIEFSNKWWGFLYLALEDSYEFVRVIEPKDWVAVVTFDMRPQILQDFTQNRYEVTQALDRLRLPGFSEINLYDALAFTIDRMKDTQGRKAILAVCTGYDTFSKLTYDQMLKIARTSDTAIYPLSILEFVTVRYGDSIDSLQARNALTTIAKYSGGQAYFPRFEGELPGIFQQIAAQLRMQYSLGFIPTNPSRDGKFHKLKIDLVDAQGNELKMVDQKGKKVKYRLVGREGYYAPKS